MSDLQRQLRVINEHNSDGTHNAKAATTLKTLLPASATPAASTVPISDANGKLDGWVTVALTKYFKSAEQTITSAGALTIAHGFGVTPKKISGRLICKTSEFNYSIGDTIDEFIGNAYFPGFICTPDSTNLNIRYNAGANVFSTLDKTTGTAASLTNGSWKVIFRAWA